MTETTEHSRRPAKDSTIGTSKSGGETPDRRFGGREFDGDYAQKGDIERPPFEGHPSQGANKARPHREPAEPDTAGQHGQRPKQEP